MTVAENIKTIRKQKGLTQKQLAELIGVSVGAVQQFEYGKIIPKMDTVLLMSNKLNVSPRIINPDLNWDDYIYECNVKKLSDFTIQELLQEIERRCSK